MDRLAFEASEIDINGITVAAADRLKTSNTTDNNIDTTGYKYIN